MRVMLPPINIIPLLSRRHVTAHRIAPPKRNIVEAPHSAPIYLNTRGDELGKDY